MPARRRTKLSQAERVIGVNFAVVIVTITTVSAPECSTPHPCPTALVFRQVLISNPLSHLTVSQTIIVKDANVKLDPRERADLCETST